MEFRTKMVVARSTKKAWLAYIGLGIAVCSLFLLLVPGLRTYVTWTFITGIVVVVIGAYAAKGDIAVIGLSEEDLVLTADKLCLGDQEYPLSQIKNLDFDVNGYSGMQDPFSAYKLDGMGNLVSFQMDGREVKSSFYLNSKEHVRILGEVFKLLYGKHIPFIERTGRTRTYLFRDLDAAGLAEFKKKYGYA